MRPVVDFTPRPLLSLCLLALALLMPQWSYGADGDWTIKIKSSVGGYNSTVTLGEFADASIGYDVIYDAPAHSTAAAVVAYFDHTDWGLDETRFWYDIQSIGHTRQWTFYTDSNLDGQSLTLEWYFANVPDGYQLTLTDDSNGQSVDMMTETSYSYVSGDLRQFTVTAVLPSPPSLTVTKPADGAVVDASNITLSGTASDAGQGDSGIAAVTVNGQTAAGATATGADTAQWSFDAVLVEGVNNFTIVASDASVYNDQTSTTLTVTYIPNPDSDGNGLLDEWEIEHLGGLGNSATADGDEDGLDNAAEYNHGTDPQAEDSDGDGLSDGAEVDLGTDPTNNDSDGDGDSDGDELRYGADPNLAADTIDDHRPAQPLIQQIVSPVELEAQVFDSGAFVDIDSQQGDYLAVAQWQIATAESFADTALVLDRSLVSSDAATARALNVAKGVLRAASQYWVRTRHRDASGLWSDWSPTVSLTTVSSAANDLEGDGIDDRYQVSAYVDTNGNAVDDRDEAGLQPIHSASFSATVGVAASAGAVDYLSVMEAAAISVDERPSGELSYDLFDFRVAGLNVDPLNPASVDVVFYFPEDLPADTRWYKYDPATGAVSDFSANAVFSGRTVTVTLTDGGAGDADGVVNGVIIDPSGPLLAATATGDSDAPDTGNGGTGSSSTTASGGSGGLSLYLLLFSAGWLLLRGWRYRRR